jgi:CMP-N-acetylneuraminic acid synthetase
MKRSEELARDDSKSSDVAISELDYMEFGIREGITKDKPYDYVMLLEPTSPLRTRWDIDAAIWRAQFEDALVSYGEVHMEHPYLVRDEKMKPIWPGERTYYRRQEYPRVYFPYGAIYICKTEVLKREETFYPETHKPYFLERWQCYEIDDREDFICTEAILKEHLNDVLIR